MFSINVICLILRTYLINIDDITIYYIIFFNWIILVLVPQVLVVRTYFRKIQYIIIIYDSTIW